MYSCGRSGANGRTCTGTSLDQTPPPKYRPETVMCCGAPRASGTSAKAVKRAVLNVAKCAGLCSVSACSKGAGDSHLRSQQREEPECGTFQWTARSVIAGVRLARTSLAHFATMVSVLVAIRHAPFPARAIPSHISTEVEAPIPSVKTRTGACSCASATLVEILWIVDPEL